jgi:hypothetical protein
MIKAKCTLIPGRMEHLACKQSHLWHFAHQSLPECSSLGNMAAVHSDLSQNLK